MNRAHRARSPSSAFHGRFGLALALAAAVAPAACGGGESSSSAPPSKAPPIATPGSAAVATEKAVDQAAGNAPAEAPPPAAGGTAAAPVAAGLANPDITNDDFLDAPEHRDPFAPFVTPKTVPVATAPNQPLPNVPMPAPEDIAFPDTDLGDLQCRMVLAMAGEKPRAYLFGPEDKSEFVTQGEYVGRSIRAGANEPETHWRVYEIQEGGASFELSNATGQEGDTGVRPALRLYNDEEMRRFENLFSLR